MELEIDKYSSFSQDQAINRLKENNSSLLNQNQLLKKELDKINTQCLFYKLILETDPMFVALKEMDPQNMKLFVDQFTNKKSSELNEKITILDRTRQEQDKLILNLERQMEQKQKKIHQLQEQVLHYQIQIEDTYFQLDFHMKQIITETKASNDLKQAFKQYEAKWLKLANSLNQLKEEIEIKFIEHKTLINTCRGILENIHSIWKKNVQFVLNSIEGETELIDIQKLKELKSRFQKQSVIMEELGKELDKKNDEIVLLTNKNHRAAVLFPKKLDFSEEELIKIKSSSTEREKQFTEMLKLYQEMLRKMTETKEQNEKIFKQYDKIKQKLQQTTELPKRNNELCKELEHLQRKNEEQKNLLLVAKNEIQELLKENDAFRHFLYYEYGRNAWEERKKQIIAQYEKRREERMHEEKWASIEELVEMNHKLRGKMRKTQPSNQLIYIK